VVDDLKTVALRFHLLLYQGSVFPEHYAILLAYLDQSNTRDPKND
jgi:hypothetical protein